MLTMMSILKSEPKHDDRKMFGPERERERERENILLHKDKDLNASRLF